MHWDSKKFRIILNWTTRSFFVVVLLFIAFSPLGQIFETQTAQAKTCRAPEILGGYLGHSGSVTVGDNEPCPEKYTEVKNPEQGWLGQGVAEFLSNIVYIFTVGLGSLLAYIAGYFFNLAVYLSLNSTAYALDFLTKGWESVRNIANMGFIFILIYIAVSITLSAETSKTMQTLVRVIAIALVINFSFFFVRIIIDGGNILAINFYNATTDQTVGESLSKADTTNTVAGYTAKCVAGAAGGTLCGARNSAKDLTAGIMGAISVQTILNEKSFKEFADRNSSSVGGFFSKLIALVFIYICVGIIFGLLAAMFFVAGIKFISRVVVLWVVIISAPLALLMYAMPDVSGMRGYYDKWRNALIAYSLYPAVFLFLYIFIIQLTYGLAGCDVSQAGSCTKNLIGSTFADINNTSQVGLAYILGLVATIAIKLGFIMTLFMLAMQAAEYVSKLGGDIAQKITARPDAWAAGIAGFTRRLSTAPARIGANFAYRSTVGLGANSLDKSLKSSLWANSRLLNNAILGHPVTAIREGVLQPVAKVGIGGGLSRADYNKKYDEREKERKANIRTAENLPAMRELQTLIGKGTLTSSEAARKALLQRRVDNFTKQELEAMKVDDLIKNASVFKESGAKKIADIEKFSEQKREEFREAYSREGLDTIDKKLDKEVILLRKIHEDLQRSGKTVVALARTVGTTSAPTAGMSINSTEVGLMRKETKKEIARVRSDIKAAIPGANTFDMQQHLDSLQEIVSRLDKTDELLAKGPPGTDYKTK